MILIKERRGSTINGKIGLISYDPPVSDVVMPIMPDFKLTLPGIVREPCNDVPGLKKGSCNYVIFAPLSALNIEPKTAARLFLALS